MEKKRIINFVLLALGLFSCIFLLIFLSDPSITGMVVYSLSEQTKVWNSDDFIPDANTEIVQGEVRLKSTINIILWNTTSVSENQINLATYDGNEHTDKVISLDSQHLEIIENKIFNVFFNSNLKNGDIIQIYLKQGTETDIFLCNQDEECEYPGYGAIYYSGGGSEGFYNITLSNLNSSINSFRITADKTFGIDYIISSISEIHQHSEQQIVYPLSGEIQTTELSNADLAEFKQFFSQDSSHGQPIVYYYSTDSGNIWSQITSDNLSNINPENQKIKIKAVLNSNQTETPSISYVSVSYLIHSVVCSEDWAETYSECSPEDKKLKYYIDINNCGTSDGIPADNGTFESCDYCAPFLTNTTKSLWQDITQCQINDSLIQSRTWAQYDFNYCNEIANQTFSEQQSVACDYCIINLTNTASEWQNITECYPNSTLIQSRNQTEYDINNCYSITNLDEDNFTNITHIEYRFENCSYSAPVTETIVQSSSSGGGGGGGGGGSRTRTVETVETPKTTAPKQEPTSSASAVAPIYDLKISIPDAASLLDSEPVDGQITNLGNIALEKVNVVLSPELSDLFQESSITFDKIDAGQTLNFVLTKNPEIINRMTGAAISNLNKKELVTGRVILTAFNKGKQVIMRKDTFKVEILTESEQTQHISSQFTPIFSFIVLLLIIAFYLSKTLRNRKQSNKSRKRNK